MVARATISIPDLYAKLREGLPTTAGVAGEAAVTQEPRQGTGSGDPDCHAGGTLWPRLRAQPQISTNRHDLSRYPADRLAEWLLDGGTDGDR
jgi:hypothetical protein